ncbi:hypothetical protein LTR57_007723 [Friedmanniomyces endolithicus]|nr:hypothetical protein LTR57_007723 [Friedmanniomyces endolithicus]
MHRSRGLGSRCPVRHGLGPLTAAAQTRDKRSSVAPLEYTDSSHHHPATAATAQAYQSHAFHVLQSARSRLLSHATSDEARTRKKADVDQKLQDAITTLRKPNRTLAVKEVAESADLSFAKATAKGRTAATKAKIAVTSAVHVASTPGGERKVKATPAVGRRAAVTSGDHERSGGTSYVPSSSARLLAPPPARGTDEPPASTFAVPQTGHRPRYSAQAHATGIEDTPSRGFAKYMPQGLAHHPGTAGASPLAIRHALQIQQTPVKPVRSLSLVPPMAEALVEASPNVVIPTELLPTSKVTDESMYDALGWEEEECEPLA